MNRLLPLAVLMLALAAGCRSAWVDPSLINPPDPKRIDLPSFGVSAPIPDGWVRENDGATVFILIPADQRGRRSDRILTLLARPAMGDTQAQAAKRIAQTENLQLAPDPVIWGGLEAVELIPTRPSEVRDGVRQAVLVRDGVLYRLAYVADPQHASILDAYQHILANTQWSTPAPPTASIAPRTPSQKLSNGMIVRIPDPYRAATRAGDRIAEPYEATNLRTGQTAITLMVIPFRAENGFASLRAVKEEVERHIAPTLQLKQVPLWTDENGRPAFATSTAVPAVTSGQVRFLLALPRNGAATVFYFQHAGGEANDAAVERTIELLKASLRAGR
jgi:hypothetical protein